MFLSYTSQHQTWEVSRLLTWVQERAVVCSSPSSEWRKDFYTAVRFLFTYLWDSKAWSRFLSQTRPPIDTIERIPDLCASLKFPELRGQQAAAETSKAHPPSPTLGVQWTFVPKVLVQPVEQRLLWVPGRSQTTVYLELPFSGVDLKNSHNLKVESYGFFFLRVMFYLVQIFRT